MSSTMTVKGSFVVPQSGIALAPDVYGLQLRVSDATGRLVIDEHVAGGAYTAELPVGWQVKGNPPTKWTYLDKVGLPGAAVDKIVITDLSRKTPGLVRVALTGKYGSFGLLPGNEPLQIAVEMNDGFDPPGGTPGVGQCGEVRFATPPSVPSCAFRGLGKLLCK